MSEYAIDVDWSEDYDRWENLGRWALEDACKHKDQDKGSKHRETNIRYSGYCEKCGVYEDSAIPMMMYAYPLQCSYDMAYDIDKILKVVKETNCTVMYNTVEDKYYLALCGGGMDLSQDIAFAYIILERWIPYSLLMNVCTQPNFSISGSNWVELMTEMKDQLDHYGKQSQSKQNEISERLLQYKKDKVN